MKALGLLVGCGVALYAFSGWSQGTVLFSNASTDGLTSPPDRLVRWAPGASQANATYVAGNPAFSNGTPGLRVQLYYGTSTASENSLVAVTTGPSTFRTAASPNAGAWFPVTCHLNGFSLGTTVNLQVRVWDSSLASSYEQAVAMGSAYQSVFLDKSAVFQYKIPTNASPLPSQLVMSNFQGFAIGNATLASRLSIQKQPNGYMRLRISGTTNQVWAFQTTTSVFTNWQTLGTNAVGTNGIAQFDHTNPPTFPPRFYRSVSPPP